MQAMLTEWREMLHEHRVMTGVDDDDKAFTIDVLYGAGGQEHDHPEMWRPTITLQSPRCEERTFGSYHSGLYGSQEAAVKIAALAAQVFTDVTSEAFKWEHGEL